MKKNSASARARLKVKDQNVYAYHFVGKLLEAIVLKNHATLVAAINPGTQNLEAFLLNFLPNKGSN